MGKQNQPTLGLRHRLVQRLMRRPFVHKAVATRANLDAFKGRPTRGVLIGVPLIVFSYIICWPAIAKLVVLAAYFEKPWMAVVGTPVLYASSHVCFILGMWCCGKKYSIIVMRWAARKGVEVLAGRDGRAHLLAVAGDEDAESAAPEITLE